MAQSTVKVSGHVFSVIVREVTSGNMFVFVSFPASSANKPPKSIRLSAFCVCSTSSPRSNVLLHRTPSAPRVVVPTYYPPTPCARHEIAADMGRPWSPPRRSIPGRFLALSQREFGLASRSGFSAWQIMYGTFFFFFFFFFLSGFPNRLKFGPPHSEKWMRG
jgi:hypothetical protein